MMKADRQAAQALADRIIKNTYRTLMTRGMKGCYVHCCDPELADYLRSRLVGRPPWQEDLLTQPEPQAPHTAKVLPLRRVSEQKRAQPGVRAVPVVDLKFAAGHFSEPQALEEGASDWVELPDWIAQQPGLFVAQVVGESMNKRIPNEAWCLFRANPQGTRNGKIVVVQHRSISDPETGGSYTIKRYRSEKAMDADGGWQHMRIELMPESDRVGFEVITMQAGDAEDLDLVAEWLMVLE
jgi:SOS-response transcriptional repressor LexA